MPSPRTLLALAVPLALVAGAAHAHAVLVSPAPRTMDNDLMAAPCGDVARTDNPTVLTPGDTITVEWHLSALHGGTMRLAFSPGADAEFEMNILADQIAEQDGYYDYSTEVTLPECTCTDCTLQLAQFLPSGYGYFSCADIQLASENGFPKCPVPAGTTTGGDTGGDGSSGGSDTGSSTGGDTTGGSTTGDPTSGNGSAGEGDDGGKGCRVASDSPGPLALLLAAPLLAFRRRRGRLAHRATAGVP